MPSWEDEILPRGVGTENPSAGTTALAGSPSRSARLRGGAKDRRAAIMIAPEATARTEPTRRDVLEASPPIFRSPALDRLTRTHPAVPALVFLPVVAASALLAVRDLGAPRALAWAAAGYVFWTLCEYWA